MTPAPTPPAIPPICAVVNALDVDGDCVGVCVGVIDIGEEVVVEAAEVLLNVEFEALEVVVAFIALGGSGAAVTVAPIPPSIAPVALTGGTVVKALAAWRKRS